MAGLIPPTGRFYITGPVHHIQMQLTDWSLKQCGRRVIALGLVVLLVGSMFASVAAADAAIGLRQAGVSATTVTVGENVTVDAQAVNVGDSGGGYTFEFESNGTYCGTTWCQFDEKRVTVPAGERRSASATIQFDEPGTYKIRVNGVNAGIVTVAAARTQVTSETDTQRRLDIRASGVSTTEPTDFDIPASNLSVALQRWSPSTGQSSFQQYLTEYTNRSEVPGGVPDPADSTLLGVIDFESEDGFDRSTMRIGVTDSVLANSTLERDEVTVYQRSDSHWEPLSTSVAEDGPERTVYEATATRGTTYAVGRIDPNISIVNTSYRSLASGNGVWLTVDGRLRNTAPIAGTYVASMQSNGETVNQTTVTVPASGEASLSLSHRVTEAGQYRLALNGTQVGSVLVSSSQVADSQSTDAPSTGEDATAGGGGDIVDAVDSVLPSTVFGISTLYLAAGLAIALGAFVAMLLLLRRGGDGGGGSQDSFDPW